MHTLWHNLKQRPTLTALMVFVMATLGFYFPFLVDLLAYGQRDWDFSFTMHAIPTWTMLEYKQWPLWNPYSMGGYSLWGNPQNPAPFSLSFLMSLIAGPIAGLKLSIILNTLIGMMGMYVFCGRFPWSWSARVLAAIVFAFNGPMIQHITEGHFVWVPFMYLPWLMHFYYRSFDKRILIYIAALWLSAQFWAGGTYVFAFSVMLVGLFGLTESLSRRAWAPMMRLIELGVACIIFCAPRLLPVLQLLYKYPRLSDLSLDVSLSQFLHSFIQHDQVALHNTWQGTEISAYIGWIVLALIVVSLKHWWLYWRYWSVGLFFFLVALGDVHPYALWNILHDTVLGYFRFPTRFVTPLMFVVAILCGAGLSTLLLWKPLRHKFIGTLITALIIINLFWVLQPVLKEYRVDVYPPASNNHLHSFSQINTSDDTRYTFANSNMLTPLYHQQGTTNAYDALTIPTYAQSKNHANYRGEVYLEKAFGSVEFDHWSPNHWRMNVNTTTNNLLVINQNYHSGWRVDDDRDVIAHQGRLAVAVTPDDKSIILRFVPQAMLWGWMLLSVGLLLISWDVWLYRHRSKNGVVSR